MVILKFRWWWHKVRINGIICLSFLSLNVMSTVTYSSRGHNISQGTVSPTTVYDQQSDRYKVLDLTCKSE